MFVFLTIFTITVYMCYIVILTFTKLLLLKGDLKEGMEQKLKSSGIPGDLFEIMVSVSM